MVKSENQNPWTDTYLLFNLLEQVIPNMRSTKYSRTSITRSRITRTPLQLEPNFLSLDQNLTESDCIDRFHFVIKQLVHASVRMSRYLSTWEVWRALKRLELRYASFVLSKFRAGAPNEYFSENDR